MHFKSILEERVWNALKAAGVYTSGFSCMKEYQWSKLFSNMKSLNAVDFYYPDLKLIIEVDGEQHYKPVSFGEKNDLVVLDNFTRQKNRDSKLRHLCSEFDIYLLSLHYKDIRKRTDLQLESFIDNEVMNLIGG